MQSGEMTMTRDSGSRPLDFWKGWHPENLRFDVTNLHSIPCLLPALWYWKQEEKFAMERSKFEKRASSVSKYIR